MTPGADVIGWLISWTSISSGAMVSVAGQGTAWLAIAVAVQAVAWCASPPVPAWACAALTVPVVAALAHAVVYRARRQVRQAIDDALGIVCDPCNGDGPGHCTCPRKCAHPWCGADDTGVRDWSAGLAALLEQEGDQRD